MTHRYWDIGPPLTRTPTWPKRRHSSRMGGAAGRAVVSVSGRIAFRHCRHEHFYHDDCPIDGWQLDVCLGQTVIHYQLTAGGPPNTSPATRLGRHCPRRCATDRQVQRS